MHRWQIQHYIHAQHSKVRYRQITGLIRNMVAQDLQPAATVEGEGFHSLMRYVEPGYKVPSAMHITKAVHQKHDIGK